MKQETVSGSGISWAICKSAPRSSVKKALKANRQPENIMHIGKFNFMKHMKNDSTDLGLEEK